VKHSVGPRPAAILCADWGKAARKRRVYVADVEQALVRRLSHTAWTFATVLQAARDLRSNGPVLVALDAAFGVPESYLQAVQRERRAGPAGFLDLLRSIDQWPGFFDAARQPHEWRPTRPFVHVPGVAGGKTAFFEAAARQGVDLLRRIDRATGAKPIFITAGIPGSVGSATVDLWQAISPTLNSERDFRIWPFEGSLSTLLAGNRLVVAEVYPTAAYAVALAPTLDATGASHRVASKTDRRQREAAIAVLQAAEWVTRFGVTCDGLEEAAGNDDDFDALMTTAALLRCALEGRSPEPVEIHAPEVEGGILLSDLAPPGGAARSGSAKRAPRQPRLGESEVVACPIPGCTKVFAGRGGWDAHVASLRTHPGWHPDVSGAAERKRLFREAFGWFFERDGIRRVDLLSRLRMLASCLSTPGTEEIAIGQGGFIARAYALSLVDAGFDWGSWGATAEGRRLRDDADAVAAAGPEQLQRLLTAVIRADRFVEGAFDDAWQRGVILALLQRASLLATSASK